MNNELNFNLAHNYVGGHGSDYQVLGVLDNYYRVFGSNGYDDGFLTWFPGVTRFDSGAPPIVMEGDYV